MPHGGAGVFGFGGIAGSFFIREANETELKVGLRGIKIGAVRNNVGDECNFIRASVVAHCWR
jgi:hypothetical protein